MVRVQHCRLANAGSFYRILTTIYQVWDRKFSEIFSRSVLKVNIKTLRFINGMDPRPLGGGGGGDLLSWAREVGLQ